MEARFLNTAEDLDRFLESIPDDSRIAMEACSVTKQGNELMRWILIQCVQKTILRPNAVQRTYYRLLKKKGVKTAKVASARKLLVYIWIMLTHEVRFEELRVNSA